MNGYNLTSRPSVILVICMVTVLFMNESVNSAATNESKPGGELVASLYASPHHLNPAIQSGLATAVPGTQIFAGLVRFDNEWNPHPYLAERWEISEDGLAVTVHLARNAVFHDGHPITSEDVEFSILAVKSLHPFRPMLAPVEKVDRPDPQTAVIRLNKPHPAIMLAMSPALLPILPKHVYGSVEKVKGHPANMKPIGSGPFILQSFVPGKEAVLRRNPDFFIPNRPYLDRIRMKFIQNAQQQAMDMEVGNLHLMASIQDVDGFLQLKSQKHVTVIKEGFKGIGPIYWMAFNLRSGPFQDIRVRQALAYAIDREFIVGTLFRGEMHPETGPISSSSPFYSSDVNMYRQDFEKANRLLDEAGYPRDRTGKRFSFRFTYISDKSQSNRKLVEYFRQLFLRELGLEVKIEHPENFVAWAEKVANRDFDVTLDNVFNWGDPVIGVHRTYLSTNIRKGVIWSNTQGYINPKADALMTRAAMEIDFPKRRALYHDFQRLITGELPVYPLYQPLFAIAHDKRLGGVGQSIWGLMSPLDAVYWKK